MADPTDISAGRVCIFLIGWLFIGVLHSMTVVIPYLIRFLSIFSSDAFWATLFSGLICNSNMSYEGYFVSSSYAGFGFVPS